MKALLYFLCTLMSLQNCLHGQTNSKPAIDTSVFYHWPSVSRAEISPQGGFLMYSVVTPMDNFTRVIQATSSNWRVEIHDLEDMWSTFLGDRTALMLKKDTLLVVTLGGTILKIPEVTAFKAIDDDRIFVQKQQDIFRLKGLKLIHLLQADAFDILPQGTLLAKRFIDQGEGTELVAFQEGKKEKVLWRSPGPIGPLIFNNSRNKVAFIGPQNSGDIQAIVIDLLLQRSITLTSTTFPGWKIEAIEGFNKSDKKLIIQCRDTHVVSTFQPNPVALKVWRTMDALLPVEQKKQLESPKTRVMSFDINTSSLVCLQQDFDDEFSFIKIKNSSKYAFVVQRTGDCVSWESDFVPTCLEKYWLEDINTGKRRLLPSDFIHQIGTVELSPDEKFLVFYNGEKKSVFSYDIEQNRLLDITPGLYYNLFPKDRARKALGFRGVKPRGIAGWVSKEQVVLLYGDYDIWQIDLKGQKKPLNLTSNIQANGPIKFQLFDENAAEYPPGSLVVQGFNMRTKEDGFYQIHIGQKKDAEKLSAGPYKYREIEQMAFDGDRGMAPIRASASNVYVVSRQSSTESPNYFLTKDFKSFQAISEVYPERKYNWPTAELHNYFTPDGKVLQGVLYKPANFDPSRKYPILFTYYEIVSNQLNSYIKPEPLCNGCHINVPYMVANDYLVFLPDMLYKPNEAGLSALIAVESAARHLGQFAWVDTSRMGLQGCSWGGFETNFIATHSTMFKAAFAASGSTDVLTALNNHIVNEPYYFPHWQHRFIDKPWDNPQAYIKESIVYNAQKLNTPLLFMHTTADSGVPFNEAVQLFAILRQLHKPAWLLEYGGGADHGLFDRSQAMDLGIRSLQFFDHFLKGKPAPVWMTKGIPAAEAATNDGLQLDLSSTPKN